MIAIEALSRIQKSLKVPKGQKNEFGNYKYRSAEDIQEAVKTLLLEGEVVRCTDNLVLVGDRYYVKATAWLIVGSINDPNCYICADAFAREEEHKKGMDGAQITGSASSYARKYALSGLFAIDDTKDADATNTHGKGTEGQIEAKFTPEQRSLQATVITKIALCQDATDIDALLDEYMEEVENLPEEMSSEVNSQLEVRRRQIKDGITPQVVSHKFASVDDAINWMKKMSPVVNGFKTTKAMDSWEPLNRPFIQGLDCLSAKKYLKENKAPKERFLDALAAKRSELTAYETTQKPIG